MVNSSPVTFTYAVDGGLPSSPVGAAPPTPINQYNGVTPGPALIRITGVGAGSHTINIVETAGTGLDIIGVGTPSPLAAYGAPIVLSAGVTKDSNDDFSAGDAAYNADSKFDAQLLYGDGLHIYFVDVYNYLSPDPSFFFDDVHPNDSGHSIVRDAFESVAQFVPVANSPQTPADNAACSPGSRYYDANFQYVCVSSGTVKRTALSTF
jgi:hypothetical protein